MLRKSGARQPLHFLILLNTKCSAGGTPAMVAFYKYVGGSNIDEDEKT